MPTITLSMPDELKEQMEEFEDINWSALAREAIKQRIIMLKKFKEFTKNSAITEKDAIELGRKVNESMHKRYKALRSKS